MRSRPLFFILLLAGSFVVAVPHLAHATAIPYWGPIVPSNDATCAASWEGVIQLINNLIAFGITILIAFFAPLMFAYAGFLYVVNPVNPSGRSQANTMMLNVIVGIVLALAGYLIVNFLLTALTAQGVSNWTSEMFSSGVAPCLPVNTSTLNQSAGVTPTAGGLTSTAAASNVPFSPSGQGSCDPSVVQQGAAAGGYTISNSEAGELACISQYESTCGTANGPDNLNYNWNKGSSAAGAFQVLLSTNSTCYDNSACESAAGTPGQALNCKSGFSGGNPIPGSAVAQECENAAGNVNCSSAAAACLLQQQSFSQAYGADSHAASCQNQYGG